MTSRAPAARRAGASGPPTKAVLGHGDLGTSLLYVFPLFLAYEVGVLFAPAMNGVDFVSRHVYAAVGYDRRNYLLVHLGLALIFAGFLVWQRRRRAFAGRPFLPMLLESGIYALTLGSFIVFVMRNVLRMDLSLAVGGGTELVLSLGAGVHEELVFRLGLCAGGAALARLVGLSHGAAVALAFVVSSALFSGAHHIGPAGDPWSLTVFTYRMLAGLLFATLFYFRSLAHAVYTHALYDIYVLILR